MLGCFAQGHASWCHQWAPESPGQPQLPTPLHREHPDHNPALSSRLEKSTFLSSRVFCSKWTLSPERCNSSSKSLNAEVCKGHLQTWDLSTQNNSNPSTLSWCTQQNTNLPAHYFWQIFGDPNRNLKTAKVAKNFAMEDVEML